VNDGVMQERVEVALLCLGDLIAIIEDVINNGDLRSIAAVAAAGDCAGCSGDGVLRTQMIMHEDVPFDPGIGAIEVKHVIARPGKNIVDEMHNWLAGAIAAGKIDHVVVSLRLTEEITIE